MDARKNIRQLLTDETTFATTLLVLLLDMYGPDALEWDPQTVVLEFADDFGVELSRENLDKLMTAREIFTSDDFFRRLPIFVQFCNILAGDDVRPDMFNPADAAECAWGIVEGLLICPPEDDEPFCDEIRYYVGKALDDEGIKNPPDVLRIALYASDGEPSSEADFGSMSLTDPAMFGGEFQIQQSKADEISRMIKENLNDLIRQLHSLPLQTGRTEALLEKIQAQGWR
jgi:hypothetical protein